MIKVYTTDTCPKCRVLKEKLSIKGIEYDEVQDLNILMDKGINFVPVLEVDGNMMDFVQANKWVNE